MKTTITLENIFKCYLTTYSMNSRKDNIYSSDRRLCMFLKETLFKDVTQSGNTKSTEVHRAESYIRTSLTITCMWRNCLTSGKEPPKWTEKTILGAHTLALLKFKLTYLRIRDYEKRDPVKSQHQSPHMWQAILNQIASINSPGDYNLLNDPRSDQQKNHPAEPTPA